MAEVAVCVVCKKTAKFKCFGCQSVAYCGLEHQKRNWREHKKNCPSYQVKITPEFGEYVVATRNISKGAIIVSEVPVVVGPPHTHFVEVCVSCLREGDDNVECNRCGWPICGMNCPGRASVARHKAECGVLKTITSLVSFKNTKFILPLRCIMLQKKDPRNWEILQKLALRALVGGVVPSSLSLQARSDFEKTILKPLTAVAPELLPDCSPETVKQVFDALDAYGLGITCPEFGPAVAVFAVTSVMEHSCIPNTRRLMEVPAMDPNRGLPIADKLLCRVAVKAHKSIAKGEHINSLFIDCVASTFERQVDLRNRRNVHCKCARCLDPTELGTDFGTLKCSNAPCSGWVLPIETPEVDKSDWKCQSCDKIYPADDIQNLMKTLDKMSQDCLLKPEDYVVFGNRWERDAAANPKLIEEVLTKLQASAHPNHHFCFRLENRLQGLYASSLLMCGYASFLDDFQLERAAELARRVLHSVMNPAIVSQYAKLTEAAMCLGFAKGEIAQRKVASGEWTRSQAKAAQLEGKELCARAFQLRYGLLNETPEGAESTLQLSNMFGLDMWQMMARGDPLYMFS